VFTCVGTSGKEPLAAPSPIIARQQQPLAWPGSSSNGGGAGAATAAEGEAPPNVDPDAFMAAFKSMLANMGQQPGGGR
jgi:hypothetical protein